MSAGARARPVDPAVAWHDVECGTYDADLWLWEELAAERGGPVLELGAGTGRVALHLARRGHEVVAVERVRPLAAELGRRARAARAPIEVVRADARALDLGRAFALALAPMQFIQLFVDPDERRDVLARCRAHLEPEGVLAAALIDGVPDAALPPEAGEERPLPDLREVDGVVYASAPLGVSVRDGVLESERRRERVSPSGAITTERHIDRLALVDVAALEADARGAGLEPVERVEVAPSDAHVGSIVAILGAAG